MYIKNYNTTQQLNTHQIVVVVIQFTKENSEWSILCKNQQNEIFWGNKKKIEDQAKIGRGGGWAAWMTYRKKIDFFPPPPPHLGLSQLFFLARMTGILGDLFFFLLLLFLYVVPELYACFALLFLLCFIVHKPLHTQNFLRPPQQK